MEQIYLSPPDMGADERRLMLEAFDSNWVAPIGPHLDAFETEVAQVAGVAHAVAVSSGTAALHLALRLLGVGTGDDVLVPTLTFVATANAVTYTGASPVFIDAHPATWTLDPALVADELDTRASAGRLPAAVISVDLYGQCADYEPLVEACERHGVPLIEDAAEALGATYKGRPAGSFGQAAIFSFNGNKVITTGGGGMLVSNDSTLVSAARHLATQARDPAPHYEHSTIGYNYRLGNVPAAIGRGQLMHLEAKVARRRAINEAYRHAFSDVPGISFMPGASYGEPTNWLTVILIDPKDSGVTTSEVRTHLQHLNIEARPAWKPMHLQPVFADAPVRGGAVSEEIFGTGLCLPSGSSLTDADIERVIAAVFTTAGMTPGRH
jgi:dTDP-4-amino-4,6-dideoxygalactose transaminase